MALIDYLSQKLHYNFNEEESILISSYFIERKFLKKDFILREGDISKNYFIIQGALRMFYLDENFKEYNLRFGFENFWLGDVGSFINQSPTRLNIQAIENTKVLEISYNNQEKLLDQFQPLNKLFRKLSERAFVVSNERVLNLISSSSIQRYHSFLSRYKTYDNRLPDSYVASYIGVTPEYYSKIKKEYIQSLLS